MTKLNVPVGTSEVHQGDKKYTVTDGKVDVPDDVAEQLLKSHSGFSKVPSEAEVKDKTLHLKK